MVVATKATLTVVRSSPLVASVSRRWRLNGLTAVRSRLLVSLSIVT